MSKIKKTQCEDCGADLEYRYEPVWRDIKIPFTGITIIIGRWIETPFCSTCIMDSIREQEILDAGEDFF